MTQELVDTLAKKLWDYHKLNHKLEKADCILTLGSYDTRVAERAAEVYIESWAPLVIFSGGSGKLTKHWAKSEAEKFAEIAINLGVPKEAILIENKSTNTGENILFSRKLLQEKGFNPSKFILVQKPYMERRSFATFRKLWPEKVVYVTSPQIPYEKYPNNEVPKERIINSMVGDLQRIKIYPKRGYAIPQNIPKDVCIAYETLVSLGFTKHLIS